MRYLLQIMDVLCLQINNEFIVVDIKASHLLSNQLSRKTTLKGISHEYHHIYNQSVGYKLFVDNMHQLYNTHFKISSKHHNNQQFSILILLPAFYLWSTTCIYYIQLHPHICPPPSRFYTLLHTTSIIPRFPRFYLILQQNNFTPLPFGYVLFLFSHRTDPSKSYTFHLYSLSS